jgi:hypothetical protein
LFKSSGKIRGNGARVDIEEQYFESPFLIAKKGHSSRNKSKIAYELA